MVKKNKLKQALKEGKVIKGVLQFIPHPDMTEMLAATGWDFIQFEAEHAISVDEGKILTLAADASGITPLVKLAGLDPLQIAHWLDAGCQGVKVQHIRSKADAEQVVKACKHEPTGIRSWCRGTRAAGHFSDSDFAKKADEEVMVIVTIEDLEGIKNLEAICSVEGVDVVAVGPGDMSAALGVPGQQDHPKVRDTFLKLIDTCRSKGVAAGVNTAILEAANLYVERGAQMIVFSGEKRIAYQGFLKAKQELDEALAGIPAKRSAKT